MTISPTWPVLVATLVILALHLWMSRDAFGTASVWLRTGALLVVAVMALQPAIAGGDDTPTPTATDVVLVIDRTTSMGAVDYFGTSPRMTGVAEDVSALVAAMPTARYAVVVMDNDARIEVPWTTDTTAVVSFVETMGWREESYGIGSDISVGKPVAEGLLAGSAEDRPQARRFMLYMGDGEQTMAINPSSFEPLSHLLTDSAVLGYGTETGGEMTLRPDTDELVERDGIPQVSRIDQASLQQISDELGGTYHLRSAPGGLDFWPDGAGAATGDAGVAAYSLSWLLALGAAAVLAIDVWLTTRRTRAARREVRG